MTRLRFTYTAGFVLACTSGVATGLGKEAFSLATELTQEVCHGPCDAPDFREVTDDVIDAGSATLDVLARERYSSPVAPLDAAWVDYSSRIKQENGVMICGTAVLIRTFTCTR